MRPARQNIHQFTVMKLTDILNAFLHPTLTLRLFSARKKKQHCRHITNQIQSFTILINLTDATVYKDVQDLFPGA